MFIKEDDYNLTAMEKYASLVLAEQSISNYINLLEEESGVKILDEDKEWLYTRGREIFDSYYIDKKLFIAVASEKDNDKLNDYMSLIHQTLGRMYSHILMAEFKYYLLTKEIDFE